MFRSLIDFLRSEASMFLHYTDIEMNIIGKKYRKKRIRM